MHAKIAGERRDIIPVSILKPEKGRPGYQIDLPGEAHGDHRAANRQWDARVPLRYRHWATASPLLRSKSNPTVHAFLNMLTEAF
jgi:hypothetical protein